MFFVPGHIRLTSLTVFLWTCWHPDRCNRSHTESLSPQTADEDNTTHCAAGYSGCALDTMLEADTLNCSSWRVSAGLLTSVWLPVCHSIIFWALCTETTTSCMLKYDDVWNHKAQWSLCRGQAGFFVASTRCYFKLRREKRRVVLQRSVSVSHLWLSASSLGKWLAVVLRCHVTTFHLVSDGFPPVPLASFREDEVLPLHLHLNVYQYWGTRCGSRTTIQDLTKNLYCSYFLPTEYLFYCCKVFLCCAYYITIGYLFYYYCRLGYSMTTNLSKTPHWRGIDDFCRT